MSIETILWIVGIFVGLLVYSYLKTCYKIFWFNMLARKLQRPDLYFSYTPWGVIQFNINGESLRNAFIAMGH